MIQAIREIRDVIISFIQPLYLKTLTSSWVTDECLGRITDVWKEAEGEKLKERSEQCARVTCDSRVVNEKKIFRCVKVFIIRKFIIRNKEFIIKNLK